MTHPFTALALRVEQSKGPDRALDCLIYEYQRPDLTPEMRGTYYGEPTGAYFTAAGEETPDRAPKVTASALRAIAVKEEKR